VYGVAEQRRRSRHQCDDQLNQACDRQPGGTDRNSAIGLVPLVAIIHGRGERETYRRIAYPTDYVHTAHPASPTPTTPLHGRCHGFPGSLLRRSG